MNVTLKPELRSFIEGQVRAGHYPSPEAVIEAGVARLMLDADPTDLDEETLAAIDRAEEQIERGQYRDWKEVSVELRRKHLGK